MYVISREAAGYLGQRLTDSYLYSIFQEQGAILLRNVVDSPEDFGQLSDRIGTDWIAYPLGGREMVSEEHGIQTVNITKTKFSAHSEMCHMPLQPHLACFYCETPPKTGGATTLYDGRELTTQMPDDLRDLFSGRHFRYRNWWPLDEALVRYNVTDKQQLLELIEQRGWENCLWVEEDTVVQAYCVPTFTSSVMSDQHVFVNQLLHNAQLSYAGALAQRWALKKVRNPIMVHIAFKAVAILNKLGPSGKRRSKGVCAYPTFEDGSIVPRWAVQKLDTFVQSHEQKIRWSKGDVLIFDNTRFMHGRTAIKCDDRRILTRFGYPKLSKYDNRQTVAAPGEVG